MAFAVVLVLICYLMCSSSRCIIWLWWFDIFITHDLYSGVCAFISEIWNTKVNLTCNICFYVDLAFFIKCVGCLGWRCYWCVDCSASFFLCKQLCYLTSVHCDLFWSWTNHCRWIKQLGWFLAVVQSLLIVASRKHYTVDVVVAWYAVNLVVFFIDKKLPGLSNLKRFYMLLPS